MSSIATPKNSFHYKSSSASFRGNPSILQNPLNPSISQNDYHESTVSNRTDLLKPEFYKQDNWFEKLCEILFKIQERETSISAECYYGFVHFISCLYVMAVIPVQLSRAGYPAAPAVVAVGACCAVGCILGGIFTNLPFVIAPPTVISIFFSVYLQSKNMSSMEGNVALVISGAILIVFFFRPLGKLADRLIPLPIQVGTTIGVGLITALAGAIDISLVETGMYTILVAGTVTSPQAIIAIIGIILITSLLFHKVKGAFCVGLILCSILYWLVSDTWPKTVAELPITHNIYLPEGYKVTTNTWILVLDLVFLYILYLSGVISAFGTLSGLKREDGTTPRSRWFYIWTGMMCILSGLIGGAPILISPESTAGIKAGAKTGLSTLVCGLYFGLACFFAPLFAVVPAAGTSPLLIMIGVLLMQDVNRLNWKLVEDAAPAFAVLFFIPFTFSIIHGVIMGYVIYVLVGITSGALFPRSLRFLVIYFPSLFTLLEKHDKLHWFDDVDAQYDGEPTATAKSDVTEEYAKYEEGVAANTTTSTAANTSANSAPAVDPLEFNRQPSDRKSERANSNASSVNSTNAFLRKRVESKIPNTDRSVDGNIGFVSQLRSDFSLTADEPQRSDSTGVGYGGNAPTAGGRVGGTSTWGTL